MNRFIIRWAINAIAMYIAVSLIGGIHLQSENPLSIIWLALIFGLLNAFLRPLLKLLTCPLIVLTLGFFTLLVNTLMFYLAGQIGAYWGVGFTVDGFLSAFLGALIVSIVSIILSMFLRDELKDRRRPRK